MVGGLGSYFGGNEVLIMPRSAYKYLEMLVFIGRISLVRVGFKRG